MVHELDPTKPMLHTSNTCVFVFVLHYNKHAQCRIMFRLSLWMWFKHMYRAKNLYNAKNRGELFGPDYAIRQKQKKTSQNVSI